MNHDQQHGLATSTPILRADAGKNACSASNGVKLVPACISVASKDQDSAPPVSIPSASIDGLPCVDLPDAQLAGGGLSNRSQPLSFQSPDHLHHKLSGSFPSQFVAPLNTGVRP